MLTQEFICGYISALGSFLEYKRNFNTYFAFQLKTTLSNKSLLDQITATIGLNNKVYCYTGAVQSYSLLIVRDRQSLIEKIIPLLTDHLIGEKELAFNIWKAKILANSSTWNYRNIKGTINPQLYQLVDKKPNNY
jgi:hypothetical protein